MKSARAASRSACDLSRVFVRRPRGAFVEARYDRFQDLAFVVDSAPEIAELAVDLHERLSCPGPQPFQSGASSRHPPGLQTKALRRVGRVARPRGLIAAWVCACCAQRRRPAVALTKPERPRGLIAAWVCACCAQRRRPAVALTKPRELPARHSQYGSRPPLRPHHRTRRRPHPQLKRRPLQGTFSPCASFDPSTVWRRRNWHG